MSYYRLYPTKNNTIFSYGDGISENKNTGANPIMELMDGKGKSKLLFGFEFSTPLKEKLKSFSFVANLQLWDAGTLSLPALELPKIKLERFMQNFSEGDGYSFDLSDAKSSPSNWNLADSVSPWVEHSFSSITDYIMNTPNEDFNFDITSTVSNYINQTNAFLNLSLSVVENNNKKDFIYKKFIHSNYTKTVFKPYIEFFINDELEDSSNNLYNNNENKIFIVNKVIDDSDFQISAEVKIDNVDTPTIVHKFSQGIYYITIRPEVELNVGNKKFCNIIWKVNDSPISKQVIEIKNNFNLVSSYDIRDLIFYPVTVSHHNNVRHGDIIPFNVISEIRRKGYVIINTYEYRVTSADGFEMIPWSKCSVYQNNIFFNINTSYFFPEQTYEVFVRNKTNYFSVTSHITTKFKVQMNDKSHLRELSSSPYYSREQFFTK